MISRRLQAVAEAAAGAKFAADVGCDHGYAAIALLKSGAERVLCMDIAEGPLRCAAGNLKKEGLLGRAELCLSDGLRGYALPKKLLKAGERRRLSDFSADAAELTAETKAGTSDTESEKKTQAAKTAPYAGGPGVQPVPDTILIAGMGGRLMTDILGLRPTNGDTAFSEAELLSEAKRFLSGVSRLVLSPQSEPELVRHFLIDTLGFAITDERMVEDEGKYYVIIIAEPRAEGSAPEHFRRELDYVYGTRLPEKKDAVFRAFLYDKKEKLSAALSSLSAAAKAGSVPARERETALRAERSEIEALLRQSEP